MSRDKQIEEMAYDMSDSLVYISGEPKIINWVATLENMYSKGYRKASDVIEEVFLALDKRTEDEGLVFIKKSDIGNAIKKKKVEIAREIFSELTEIGMVTKVVRDGEIVYDIKDKFNHLKKKYLGEDINAPTKESEGKDE